MNERKIIGLVAHPAAGKGMVSEYLQSQYGFGTISGGDILRQMLRERGEEITKLSVSSLATSIRSERGPAVLLEESLGRVAGDIVLDGLRHPMEAERLRDLGGLLLSIVTPARVSYKRMLQAKRQDRPDDDLSFEEFIEFRNSEARSDDPNGHNVDRVIEMANRTICNAHAPQITYRQVDDIIQPAAFSS